VSSSTAPAKQVRHVLRRASILESPHLHPCRLLLAVVLSLMLPPPLWGPVELPRFPLLDLLRLLVRHPRPSPLPQVELPQQLERPRRPSPLHLLLLVRLQRPGLLLPHGLPLLVALCQHSALLLLLLRLHRRCRMASRSDRPFQVLGLRARILPLAAASGPATLLLYSALTAPLSSVRSSKKKASSGQLTRYA